MGGWRYEDRLRAIDERNVVDVEIGWRRGWRLDSAGRYRLSVSCVDDEEWAEDGQRERLREQAEAWAETKGVELPWERTRTWFSPCGEYRMKSGADRWWVGRTEDGWEATRGLESREATYAAILAGELVVTDIIPF